MTESHPLPHPAPAARRTISLALQGGGSHGAFTWGVLDVLLQDERVHLDGITGTSAGAVNAVALANGFALAAQKAHAGDDPRELARTSLARLWRGVAGLGGLSSAALGVARMVLGGWQVSQMGDALSRWMSPYQSNPLDINPLRRLLEDEIDFAALGRLASPKVFVAATHVRTGRAEIFSGRRLTLQAVMASACLPTVFQAVEIDGEHYWDGGFSANPPLVPLISSCECRDIVLVQINPLARADVPHTPRDIVDRVNEMTFNASLLGQMRNIDFINRLIAGGRLQEGEKYRSLRLHRIDGGAALEELPASSKLSADTAIIEKLFDVGQAAARAWLARHFDALGQRSTIDIRHDYVGNMPKSL